MIRVESLAKRYGRTHALRDLSFEVPPGSLYGFIGPNGAGKTTTLRILATLLAPSAGRAWVGEVEVTRHPGRVRDRIGYMPDFFGVYDDLTCAEYLDFYGRSYDVPGRKRAQIVADLLDLVDLAPKRDAYVETLSRGMKQRLGLARCLVHDPAVLLLDEPASGLDPRARVEMRELLKELQRMGKTILVSSHILPELAEMCDHVAIVDAGRLVWAGPVEAIGRTVGAGRTLEIRLLRDAERAAAFVQEQPGVGAVEADGLLLRAAFAGDDAACEALLRALVRADLPVVSFTQGQSGLEDVFLRVTGDAGEEEARR